MIFTLMLDWVSNLDMWKNMISVTMGLNILWSQIENPLHLFTFFQDFFPNQNSHYRLFFYDPNFDLKCVFRDEMND